MLELDDIHVHYGNIRALQGVSLSVAEGELVALIGSNGAGKTTTLRTISGINRVSEGAIRFEGADITRAPADRIVSLGISHCPEGRRIFGSLTVRENLRLGAVSPGRQAGGGRRPRDGARAVPAARRAAGAGRRHPVGRRAADARDRARPDEPAAAAPARRAVARPGAADGGADLRDDRQPQGERTDDPAGRAERPPRAGRRRSRLRPRDRPGDARRPGGRAAAEPEGGAVVPRRGRGHPRERLRRSSRSSTPWPRAACTR